MKQTLLRAAGLFGIAALLAVMSTVPVAAVGTGVLPGSPSNFESGDGNMINDTSGDTDWNCVTTFTGAFTVGATCGTTNKAPYFHLADTAAGTSSDIAWVSGQKQDIDCPLLSLSNVPNKDDFTDVTTYSETSSATPPHFFLYGSTIRLTSNGNAAENVELKQGTNGLCSQTIGGFQLVRRAAGDKLLAFDYLTGGTTLDLHALTWITCTSTTLVCGTAGGNLGTCFVKANTPPCWGAAVLHPSPSFFNGQTSQSTISAIDNGINGQSLVAGTFSEFGIDLTATGVIPPGTCFASPQTLFESRTSGSSFLSNPEDVEVENHTISNCGTITIHKVTQNGNASFDYATTGGLSPSPFKLSGGGTQPFSNVPAGSYSVSESTPLPAGWTFVSLVCGTVTGAGTSVSFSGQTVNITMAGGGNVDCTYTNHTKLSPTITTSLSASAGKIGDTVTDSATLAGATSNAGGTVTYTVYTDSGCSLNAQPAGTVTVTSGVVPNSNPIMLNNAGTFFWQAVYSGDANNNTATSACTSEQVVIRPNPTITTSLSASAGKIGDVVTDSATLGGGITATAGGTVTYTVYTDSACSLNAQPAGTVTVTNGVVPNSNPITFNSAGTFFWQAVYSGDANNNTATSACTSEQVVIRPNPTIATSLSESAGKLGDVVTDSATLGGGITATAGGTVTYTVYTNSGCSLNAQPAGTVTVTNGVVPNSNPITFNSAGTFFWQAVYSGDANNNGATSSCASEQLIIPKNAPGATTAQNLLPNDSATLSGGFNPGGMLTFNLYKAGDSTCSGPTLYTQIVNVNGNGTYSTTNTSTLATDVGTYKWQIVYSGDSNNTGFTSACGVESFTISQ
jgi:hypothetical protein